MTDHRSPIDRLIDRLMWMALPTGFAVAILAAWLSR